MKEYSSLRIGGEGDMVIIRTLRDITPTVMGAVSRNRIISIVGEGTNTYFGNSLSKYLFVKNEIKGISFEEQGDTVLLTAYAGERWDDIVSFSVEKGLWGLENLSAIPGTVGAAPIQNIGAYGVELKDVFVSLSAYDIKTNNTVEIDREGCNFGYRDSLFKHEKSRYIIISLTIKLSRVSKPVLSYKPLDTLKEKENLTPTDVRALVIETRNIKLPYYKEYPNVGSFFKNTVVTCTEGEALCTTYKDIPLLDHKGGYKIPTAWLIERVAEMKGVRVGDIGTWPNQPLVLVNYGDTTLQELDDFVATITEKVLKKTGILLEKEVNVVM